MIKKRKLESVSTVTTSSKLSITPIQPEEKMITIDPTIRYQTMDVRGVCRKWST